MQSSIDDRGRHSRSLSAALERWSRHGGRHASGSRTTSSSCFGRLLRLASCFRREGAAITVFALLATGLGWSTSLCIQEIVDGPARHTATFVHGLAGSVVLAICDRAAIEFARQVYQRALDRRLELALATIFLRKLFAVSPMRLVGQTNKLFLGMIGVRGLGPAVSAVFLGTALDALMFAPTLVLLAMRDLRLTAVAVVTLPGYAALSYLVRRKTRASLPRLTEQDNRTAQHQVDFFGDPLLIKGFLAEDHAIERIRETIVDKGALESGLARYQAVLGAMSGSITTLVQIAILWCGGLRLIDGDMTAGQVMFFFSAIALLTGPIERIAGLPNALQHAYAALARFDELMALPDEAEDTGGYRGRRAVRGAPPAIEFHDVGFRYPGGPPVVRGISLALAPGATVAVVGETGSGKTTLVNLLMGFLVPQHGAIVIDGAPLAELDLRELRRMIGWVPQRTTLLHDTLFENIRMGRRWVGDDDVMRAAATAQAHEFIQRQPQGYRTVLAQRADQLSGGQAQRIAIARALAGDPRILVLDEATSNLDIQTEQALVNAIAAQRRARTTLIVAHRLSTIIDSDRIVVLDQGQVAEQGSHAQLVSRAGLYHAYLRRQLSPLAREGAGRGAAEDTCPT